VVATSTSTAKHSATSIHRIHGADFDRRAIQQLRACRPIPENQVRELCYKARELLIEEGNVVGVDAPVTVGTLPSQLKGATNCMGFLDLR
jgi:hypothetical protein